ncbi:MAG: hypothetical protein KKC37_02015, partial [Proteobacteria bacterium]|nr:hypothetical protein [Pseudomonadota bacterium]
MSVGFHPDHSLSRVKGVGPAYARRLAARGLRTFEDALYFLPLRYEDRRRLSLIGELRPGQAAVVQGTVSRAGPIGPPRRRRFEMEIIDDSGRMSAVWFHFRRGHLDRFESGTEVVLSGRVEVYQGRTQMVHPDLRPIGDGGPSAEDLALWPIYPQVGFLPPRRLHSIIGQVVDSARGLADPLPDILPPDKYPVPLGRAFHGLHRPPDEADPLALEDRRSPWHRTVIVNEFFYFCLGLALTARSRRATRPREDGIDETVLAKFTAALPFEPTRAQARAIAHIKADLGGDRPMSRLIMGDVGSGKTVVAAAAAALAAARGRQAAVMSPTDVLSRQLHRALGGLLA